MSMTVTALKAPQTTRRDADPLRTALAAALREAAEARESVENHRAAIDRTRVAVRDAEKAVAAAEAGIQTARQNHAAALADASSSNAAPPASGMRKARQAVEDAQDHLESTKIALGQLKQDLPSWEAASREASIAIDRLISQILDAKIQKMVDQGNEIFRQLAPFRRVLMPFWHDRPSGVVDVQGWELGRQPLAAAKTAARAFIRDLLNAHDVEQSDPWEAAREKLRHDPNAPLPEFD
jgi:hypothetical protein